MQQTTFRLIRYKIKGSKEKVIKIKEEGLFDSQDKRLQNHHSITQILFGKNTEILLSNKKSKNQSNSRYFSLIGHERSLDFAEINVGDRYIIIELIISHLEQENKYKYDFKEMRAQIESHKNNKGSLLGLEMKDFLIDTDNYSVDGDIYHKLKKDKLSWVVNRYRGDGHKAKKITLTDDALLQIDHGHSQILMKLIDIDVIHFGKVTKTLLINKRSVRKPNGHFFSLQHDQPNGEKYIVDLESIEHGDFYDIGMKIVHKLHAMDRVPSHSKAIGLVQNLNKDSTFSLVIVDKKDSSLASLTPSIISVSKESESNSSNSTSSEMETKHITDKGNMRRISIRKHHHTHHEFGDGSTDDTSSNTDIVIETEYADNPPTPPIKPVAMIPFEETAKNERMSNKLNKLMEEQVERLKNDNEKLQQKLNNKITELKKERNKNLSMDKELEVRNLAIKTNLQVISDRDKEIKKLKNESLLNKQKNDKSKKQLKQKNIRLSQIQSEKDLQNRESVLYNSAQLQDMRETNAHLSNIKIPHLEQQFQQSENIVKQMKEEMNKMEKENKNLKENIPQLKNEIKQMEEDQKQEISDLEEKYKSLSNMNSKKDKELKNQERGWRNSANQLRSLESILNDEKNNIKEKNAEIAGFEKKVFDLLSQLHQVQWEKDQIQKSSESKKNNEVNHLQNIIQQLQNEKFELRQSKENDNKIKENVELKLRVLKANKRESEIILNENEKKIYELKLKIAKLHDILKRNNVEMLMKTAELSVIEKSKSDVEKMNIELNVKYEKLREQLKSEMKKLHQYLENEKRNGEVKGHEIGRLLNELLTEKNKNLLETQKVNQKQIQMDDGKNRINMEYVSRVKTFLSMSDWQIFRKILADLTKHSERLAGISVDEKQDFIENLVANKMAEIFISNAYESSSKSYSLLIEFEVLIPDAAEKRIYSNYVKCLIAAANTQLKPPKRKPLSKDFNSSPFCSNCEVLVHGRRAIHKTMAKLGKNSVIIGKYNITYDSILKVEIGDTNLFNGNPDHRRCLTLLTEQGTILIEVSSASARNYWLREVQKRPRRYSIISVEDLTRDSNDEEGNSIASLNYLRKHRQSRAFDLKNHQRNIITRELTINSTAKLSLHMPDSSESDDDDDVISDSISQYFQYAQQQKSNHSRNTENKYLVTSPTIHRVGYD